MMSDAPRPDATELMCPWCQGPFGITLSMAGSAVHCPHCDGEITIPSRDHLLAMMASSAEPPPVAAGSPAPPVIEKSAEPPTLPARVAGEAPPPHGTPPLPAAAISPGISPPKVVHAQSREGDVVAFRARGKVIHTEHGDIELRERSRGERSFRRTVRNIVLIILCLAILIGLPAWILSQKAKSPAPPGQDNSTEPSTSDSP